MVMVARLRAQLCLVAVAIAALGALPPPAQAGSATADSIWDRKNALQRAMEAMPAGATLSQQECQTLEVGLDNVRYRCTVWWSDPPASPPVRQPAPAATP